MSDGIYFLLYHIIGYRKEVVRNNLAHAFPDKSVEERKRIENSSIKILLTISSKH
jgi:KDO2-lipid IV(A) lauroyltransferase